MSLDAVGSGVPAPAPALPHHHEQQRAPRPAPARPAGPAPAPRQEGEEGPQQTFLPGVTRLPQAAVQAEHGQGEFQTSVLQKTWRADS